MLLGPGNNKPIIAAFILADLKYVCQKKNTHFLDDYSNFYLL